jgi:hypothetical protein
VTSTDYLQITVAVHRLEQAADEVLRLTNPITAPAEVERIVETIIDLVAGDIPGDVGGLDARSTAFATMATNVGDVYADLSAISVSVPKVWSGQAASNAVAALQSTEQLLVAARSAMYEAAGHLDAYAGVLPGLRADLAASQAVINRGWHELAEGIGEALVSEFVALWHGHRAFVDGVDDIVRGLLGAAAVYRRWAGAVDTLRRGLDDVASDARAQAATGGGLDAFTAVRLADTGLDPAGIGTDDGILTVAQLTRAGGALGALSTADRKTIDTLLGGAASDVARAYLLKALIAGDSIAAIALFAKSIGGKSDDWLRSHLTIANPDQPGALVIDGQIVAQQDETTCGSMSIIMARAMNDPIYAMTLTDKPGTSLTDMLRQEEQRVHDETNTLWPQQLGTTPWGLTDVLNANSGELGTSYRWHLVDDTDAGSVGPALTGAVAAVDAGYPVPVLIGDGVPRHYVLLIAHDGDTLTFYNPSGAVEQVSEADFLNGNVGTLGYAHVQAVITPK